MAQRRVNRAAEKAFIGTLGKGDRHKYFLPEVAGFIGCGELRLKDWAEKRGLLRGQGAGWHSGAIRWLDARGVAAAILHWHRYVDTCTLQQRRKYAETARNPRRFETRREPSGAELRRAAQLARSGIGKYYAGERPGPGKFHVNLDHTRRK